MRYEIRTGATSVDATFGRVVPIDIDAVGQSLLARDDDGLVWVHGSGTITGIADPNTFQDAAWAE